METLPSARLSGSACVRYFNASFSVVNFEDADVDYVRRSAGH